MRVFRSLSTYTPGTFEGWLHRDHHQPVPRPGPPQAADPLRRALRRARRPALGGTPSPDAAYVDQRFDDDVERALATLPPDFRAAVVLCDVEGLTYEEIAEILDAKLGTVRSRIHRGRAMLRAALAHRAPPTAGPATPVRAADPRPDRRPSGSARDRPPRRPGQRPARRAALRRGGGAGLGARAQLPPSAVTRSSARAGSRPGSPASPSARLRRPTTSGARCSARPALGVPPGDADPGASAVPTPGRAGSRWSRSAAARPVPPVMGVLALGAAPADAPTIDRRLPTTRSNTPAPGCRRTVPPAPRSCPDLTAPLADRCVISAHRG